MTGGQTNLLIVALGTFGVIVGVGITASVLSAARHDRALHEFDWGNAFRLGGSSAVANRVRITEPFDVGERRFGYYTGGHSPGSGEPSPAPSRVIAESVHGAVTVRLRAFEPYTRERADDDAGEIARIVSSATTRVWPGEPTPVEVDVHFMPDDVPFSLAKRVDWQEGDSYVIAIFARERNYASGTAAHELYHALAGRWSRGTHDPASRARPDAAWAYEEATANLFAECGGLLANGALARDASSAAAVTADRRFENELDGEELAGALDLLSRDAPESRILRDLIARTVLAGAFGADDTIRLESRQGERLVAWCRESAANPMLLEFRLAELLRTAETQPARTLEN